LISYLVNREYAEGDCIETAELISSRQNNSIYLSFLDVSSTSTQVKKKQKIYRDGFYIGAPFDTSDVSDYSGTAPVILQIN
jgi:hypothetical protein